MPKLVYRAPLDERNRNAGILILEYLRFGCAHLMALDTYVGSNSKLNLSNFINIIFHRKFRMSDSIKPLRRDLGAENNRLPKNTSHHVP